MYRLSTPGNPYHDRLGKFCHAFEAKSVSCAQSFVDVENMTTEEKKEAARDIMWTDRETVDEYYYDQSCTREVHANEVSRAQLKSIDENMTEEEKRKAYEENSATYNKAVDAFSKENEVALRKGAHVSINIDENGEIAFTLRQPERRTDESARKSIIFNPSTNMEQFQGYTVTHTVGNIVESTKAGAARADEVAATNRFCERHKDLLSEKGACVKIDTLDDGRKMYSVVYTFNSEEAARTYALKHRGSQIIDNKGQVKVDKNAAIEEAETRFSEGMSNLNNKDSFAEVSNGSAVYSDGNGRQFIKTGKNAVYDTETEKTMSRTEAKKILKENQHETLDRMGKFESDKGFMNLGLKDIAKKQKTGKMPTNSPYREVQSAFQFDKKVAKKLAEKEARRKARKN